MSLRELRELAENATPGEWAWHFYDGCRSLDAFDTQGHPSPVLDLEVDHIGPLASARRQDAEFIAAANPETIKALLGLVDSLHAALQRMDRGSARLEALEAVASFGRTEKHLAVDEQTSNLEPELVLTGTCACGIHHELRLTFVTAAQITDFRVVCAECGQSWGPVYRSPTDATLTKPEEPPLHEVARDMLSGSVPPEEPDARI